MQKILFIFLITSVILLSGCLKLVKEQPYPMPGVIDQKNTTSTLNYETDNLIIPTPAPMMLRDDGEAVTLYHTVETFSHTNFCDFKGDQPMTTTLKDFTVNFSFSSLPLKEAVLKFGGDYLKNNFKTDDSIIEQEGFLTKATIGNFSGYKLTQGIEGCGNNQYFFPVKNGILIIKKDLVPELTNLNSQNEKYKAIPSVILPEKAQQLFEEVIKNVIVK
jgi:hypothetical protein